ncbi:MAG TPA: hypothetical protein VE818_06165 [Nitrososphaeraceae archaeon]|nr:hypothetical protein [Nitrososphaeraceae archaeon]
MSKHLKETYGSSLKNREVGFSASLFLFQSAHSFSFLPPSMCPRRLACTANQRDSSHLFRPHKNDGPV